MADRTVSYSEAEKRVRQLLENEYNVVLPKKKLVVGTRANGDKQFHEFDGVSSDSQIVFEVKSNEIIPSDKYPKGRYSSSIKWALLGDMYLLSRVEAKIKLFVLTHELLFDIFREDMEGILPPGIQVIYKDVNNSV